MVNAEAGTSGRDNMVKTADGTSGVETLYLIFVADRFRLDSMMYVSFLREQNSGAIQNAQRCYIY